MPVPQVSDLPQQPPAGQRVHVLQCRELGGGELGDQRGPVRSDPDAAFGAGQHPHRLGVRVVLRRVQVDPVRSQLQLPTLDGHPVPMRCRDRSTGSGRIEILDATHLLPIFAHESNVGDRTDSS